MEEKNVDSRQQEMIFHNLGRVVPNSIQIIEENHVSRTYEQGKPSTMLSVESDGALRRGDTTSLLEHNDKYTSLLNAYVEDFKNNSANKLKNKKILFVITMILFLGIPVCCLLLVTATLVCMALGYITVWESFPELIAALVSLLGTFMVIPKIITKYLFNKNEDKNLAKIIGKIQKYDTDIRGSL